MPSSLSPFKLLIAFIVVSGVGLFVVTLFVVKPQDAIPEPFLEVSEVSAAEPKVIGIIQVNKFLDPYVDGLKAGMEELGYTEGEIEYKYQIASFIPGQKDSVGIANDYIEQEVDVIYVPVASLDTLEATQASEPSIPYVFVGVYNPIETGFAESFRSSGNNATGIASNNSEYVGRRLEFLARINPQADKIAIFTTGFEIPGIVDNVVNELEQQAPKFGFEVIEYTTNTPPPKANEALLALESTLQEDGIDAIFHLPGHFYSFINERQIARNLKIIDVAMNEEEVEGGGYFTYNANYFDVGKQAAVMIDKIFKGVSPSDIPVEQPNAPRLTVNREMIEAVGIPLPKDMEFLVGREIKEIQELFEH